MKRKRVVILGGGFAGVATVRELERIGDKRVGVTLVSRHNFMLFTPMLPEIASGSIEPRDITQPLRASTGVDQNSNHASSVFELGDAVAVDTTAQTVSVSHPLIHQTKLLEYDELVFALGATESTMGIPGIEKFTVPLKTIADAEKVRARVLGALEAADETKDLIERDRLLRFVIVGGDFTGVELAGELQAFLHSAVRYYPSIDAKQVELIVVESGEHLLGHLPSKFGKYAASVLNNRGTTLRLKEAVGSIDGRGVELKGGERIASATVVWAAGEKPSPLASTLRLATTPQGAIKTGRDFAVPGVEHVWALGDCAAVPKPGGGTYAPLAQNAVREGPLLARNIVARLSGKPTQNFRYKELGQMASLGNRRALAELPGGRMLTGFPAWLLWRTYYLGRLPGARNKLRVALDWTLARAFPPQTSLMPVPDKGEADAARR